MLTKLQQLIRKRVLNINLKVKQMETKRTKVIMLPTKDMSSIYVNKYINETHNTSPIMFDTNPFMNSEEAKECGFEYQHLYITTDDEIKEGDWFILGNVPRICTSCTDITVSTDNVWANKELVNKIIATTDKSLVIDTTYSNGKYKGKKYLPQPSQAFIEKYCKVGGIDEVLVEYIKELKVGYCANCNGGSDLSFQCTCTKGKRTYYSELQLKIDSHNTITIHPIKDSWSRKEVEDILHKAFKFINTDALPTGFLSRTRIENWIKENL